MAKSRAFPFANHGHRHWRFYASLGLGIAAFFALRGLAEWSLAATAAGNAFFAAYLTMTALLAWRMTPAELRRRAAERDEGIVLIVVMTLAAIGLSLGSLFTLINAGQTTGGWRLAFAVASVPLGWTTLHTVMALHYAHFFHGQHPSKSGADAGGLAFPGTAKPEIWDFFYFSFVVGMTAQVSDVQVQSGEMRRLTLGHSVVSFFYNTVILALAVNIAVSLGR